MNINISDEMVQAVIAALRMHVERKNEQAFGKGDYQVTNYEALEFFEQLLSDKGTHYLSTHPHRNENH